MIDCCDKRDKTPKIFTPLHIEMLNLCILTLLYDDDDGVYIRVTHDPKNTVSNISSELFELFCSPVINKIFCLVFEVNREYLL